MEQLQQKLNEMAQEFGKFQLQYFQWKNEINARLEKPEVPDQTLYQLVAELDKRVKELEAARILQRQLNQSFQPKATSSKPEIKPFWSLFKR